MQTLSLPIAPYQQDTFTLGLGLLTINKCTYLYLYHKQRVFSAGICEKVKHPCLTTSASCNGARSVSQSVMEQTAYHPMENWKHSYSSS